jgi:hypothetical protein
MLGPDEDGIVECEIERAEINNVAYADGKAKY